MEIRNLQEADAGSWWQIRLEALSTEPLAFGKAVEEHLHTPVEAIARRFREAPASTLNLGAFVEGRLVGTVTFMRESGEKERHKGRIYGVYVSAEQRTKGIGRGLLARVLETASGDSSIEHILLAVATTQVAANRLYRSLGFEVFGTEPRALKVGSTYVDEHHMILRIR